MEISGERQCTYRSFDRRKTGVSPVSAHALDGASVGRLGVISGPSRSEADPIQAGSQAAVHANLSMTYAWCDRTMGD